MSASYSATLFVASPMRLPTFRSTFPDPSRMTNPIAAGPGFPLAPPSVCTVYSIALEYISDAQPKLRISPEERLLEVRGEIRSLALADTRGKLVAREESDRTDRAAPPAVAAG